MRRPLLLTALSLFLSLAPLAQSQSVTDTAPTLAAAPDYAKPETWVCRPGKEDTCTTGLDATVIDATGHTSPQPFAPAADPAIDCFYVYPTVSVEPTPFADLTPSPEVISVVRAQAGRLTSRCRLFAPIYRQTTMAGLRLSFTGSGRMNFDVPAVDVKAAWDFYLQHDNHGRGVVLIGHSQGTILLQDLIAKDIDGKPSQSLLVSAFLAGDPSLGVPPGKLVGGTFAHIPVCSAAPQTGCVYVWGSFLAADTATPIFGHRRPDGLVSACAIPAAPSGGPGTLKFFHTRLPSAPATDTPWIESVGGFTGACTAAAGANTLRVSVTPGPSAEADAAILARFHLPSGWGIHNYDLTLLQGNILDVLDAQLITWRAKHK